MASNHNSQISNHNPFYSHTPFPQILELELFRILRVTFLDALSTYWPCLSISSELIPTYSLGSLLLNWPQYNKLISSYLSLTFLVGSEAISIQSGFRASRGLQKPCVCAVAWSGQWMCNRPVRKLTVWMSLQTDQSNPTYSIQLRSSRCHTNGSANKFSLGALLEALEAERPSSSVFFKSHFLLAFRAFPKMTTVQVLLKESWF